MAEKWDDIKDYALKESTRQVKGDKDQSSSLGNSQGPTGRTAELCLHRAQVLNPFIKGIDQVLVQSCNMKHGNDDRQIMKLLEHPRVSVSACVLTGNSARTIGNCIEALQRVVDEVIVVDTGSTDSTIAIVKEHGLVVHEFQW